MPAFRRDRAVLVTVLSAVASMFAAGAAHAAPGTGGAAIPDVLPQATGGVGYGEPGTPSLVVKPIAIFQKHLVARGTMPRGARRTIVLQRLDSKRGWRNIARGRVRSTDRFSVKWKADRMGRVRLRAVLAGRRGVEASSAAGPTARVMVYRRAMATFYGPGFFGNQTACGQTLTPDMHGVAHKKLRCGTLVSITYKRREIVVPVIDRGPFNPGFSWDLTQATADALGFTGTGRIGYTRVK